VAIYSGLSMKGFCPLASGSKGNVTYLGTERTKLLIDVGIGIRTLTQRLSDLCVDIRTIDAILISHEHLDHIRSAERVATKYQIPLLANSETAKAMLSIFKGVPKFKIFSTGEGFVVGDIHIHPFSIQHDTMDPVAFTFCVDQLKIGVCTDLGFATTLVQSHLQDCDYLCVEANHDPSLVHGSSRPPICKQRILGRQGHLSNLSCAQLIDKVYHPKLKHIYLAHLSQECNHPQLAIDYVRKQLGDRQVDISIAHQDKMSKSIFF